MVKKAGNAGVLIIYFNDYSSLDQSPVVQRIISIVPRNPPQITFDE